MISKSKFDAKWSKIAASNTFLTPTCPPLVGVIGLMGQESWLPVGDYHLSSYHVPFFPFIKYIKFKARQIRDGESLVKWTNDAGFSFGGSASYYGIR